MVPNKGIILNYKNNIICLGILDIFIIGYFELEFDLAGLYVHIFNGIFIVFHTPGAM